MRVWFNLYGMRSRTARLFGTHHRGFDELAAFGELMQHGVQFAQILARQPASRRRGRGVDRRAAAALRGGGSASTMDRAIGGLDARHRRALQRRLAARLDVVLTVAEIAADQRGQAGRAGRVFFGELGSAATASSAKSSSSVAPCGGCGAPSCQTTCTNFAPCSRKMRCTPRMV